MSKCDICKKELTSLVMGKIKGTYLKGKGKIYKICSACQKSQTTESLKKKLKVK